MKGVRVNQSAGRRGRVLREELAALGQRIGTRTVLLCLVKFAGSFILCGARVFGTCRPFALAFAAAAGADLTGFFALLGLLLGDLVFMGFTAGMRYTAAGMAVFLVLFVLWDRPVTRMELFAPLLAAVLGLATGLLYLLGGLAGPGALLLGCETVLTGGCTYFYGLALRSRTRGFGGPRDIRHTASLLILIATGLIALAPLTLPANISVGRLLAILFVMASAWAEGMNVGASVGVVAGLAMDIAAARVPFFSMAYGISGLLAGLFKGKGRLSFVVAYILCNGVAVLWTEATLLRQAVLYETFVASVLFLMAPERWLTALTDFLVSRQETAVSEKPRELVQRRLNRMAGALTELQESLRRSGRARTNDNDVAAVFDAAADKVCRRCVLVNHCWQKNYETTVNALNDIGGKLRTVGHALPEDYPAYFSSRCIKLEQFASAINESQQDRLRRRRQLNRQRESREAVCSQYGQLAAALRQVSSELNADLRPDEGLERKLARWLKGEGIEAQVSVYRDHTGRLRAELWGRRLEPLIDRKLARSLSRVLGVPVGEPERVKCGGDQRIVITQLEPLAAVAGGAARNREGQQVSGDSGTYFKTDDGLLCVLLADGMGSGPEAERESALCLNTLERLLRAGTEPVSALRTLNDSLLLRDERIITAVDMLSVDLFTGRGGLYKYGAAPSYVKRGRTVRRMDGRAMAAGSGVDAAGPDVMHIDLQPGDFVLILSDGVSDGAEDGDLRRCIAGYDGDSPNELATAILELAEQCGDAVDDMTVMGIRIVKRERNCRAADA